MQIFAEVLWKGGVIQQWGNRKRVFFWLFGAAYSAQWGQDYYIVLFSPLSPFHWPQNTWPWMTLKGLNGHFTLYIHYYELPLTHYLLLIYCSLFITRVTNACDQRISTGSGVANSGPQKFGIHGKSADLPWTLGLPDFQSRNTGDFLQGVSVAASPDVLAIVGKPSVRLSVCHTLALSENDAS